MFVDINGIIKKSKSPVSGSASVHDAELKDVNKLAEILRRALRRISELETNQTPRFVEFEREVPSGGAIVSFSHNLGSPVRYSVMFWTKTASGSYPTDSPVLVVDESSTNDELVLRSHVEGKVIIRIEPSQHSISLFTE